MKLTVSLISCVLVLAAIGCRDEAKKNRNQPDNGATTPTTPRRPPTTMPAHHSVLPPPHIAQTTPVVKPADAARIYAQELVLIRKHRWSRTPTATEIAAAAKVFEGRTDAGRNDLRKAVDFNGLSLAKVKAMLGNPRYKQPLDRDEVWTYSYAGRGQNVTCSMKFHNGVVVPDVNLQVADGR
jgi:hypothetical protein